MAEAGQGDNLTQQREAYFHQLQEWLEETRRWNQQNLQRHNEFVEYMQRSVINNNTSHLRQRTTITQQQQTAQRVQGAIYKQYRIPPLWRRFIAEVLDFFILLTLKLLLVVVSLEIGTMLHIEDYWSSTDQQKIAVHLTILELFQAFMSLLYETLFLSSTLAATPGKLYMGLQVLYVDNIVSNPQLVEGTVACFPATQLSVGRALMRSIAKHVLCAFLFPVFYSFLTIEFNRTRYDLYASTIVVEYDPNPATHVF